MTPVTMSITTWRNARYVEEFPFTAPVPGDDNAPYDLTSWSAKMQVRLYGAQPGLAVISLPSVTSDIQGVWIAEPASGIVRVRIDESTLSAAWNAVGGGPEAGDPIKLKYDLVLTTPNGADEVWAQGDFIINPGVTV